MLTISVSVASVERNFSKLKLIKSYLKLTMSQERLNRLAILSIEKGMLEKFDYKNLVKNFISQKSRKISLFRRSVLQRQVVIVNWEDLVFGAIDQEQAGAIRLVKRSIVE